MIDSFRELHGEVGVTVGDVREKFGQTGVAPLALRGVGAELLQELTRGHHLEELREGCLRLIKEYLSFMPQHCEERPPIVPCDDPLDRRDESLLDILPLSARQSYDMYGIVKTIVDHGRILDLKPKWAKNIITCSPAFTPCSGARATSRPAPRKMIRKQYVSAISKSISPPVP